MLISYIFNNYCSFYGENEFSMETAGGKVKKRYPDNYVETASGVSLLKSAVLVGENAGGKSNFINSLRFLKSLFTDNGYVKSFRPFINSDSMRMEKTPAQKFEIVLLADNGLIYQYVLVIDEKGIVSEQLNRQGKLKGKRYSIFHIAREEGGKTYFAMGKDTGEIEKITDKRNVGIGLFVTKLAIIGNEDAAAVTEWINNKLVVEELHNDIEMDYKRQQSDLDILKDKRYIDIFRMVDYSISGIELDEDKPYSKTLIIRKNKAGEQVKRELQMDSAGVKEFFVWATQIFRVVYENKVVLADEMDRVLNPILSDRVISFVNGKQHMGQFIFSTHNVLHLNLVMYMKEQIYFVTKARDSLTSEIYSLADFPEVRYETVKIYEFYMKGILGGTAFE